MMFQGSRNLDQPIAHWLMGCCYVLIHFLGPPISDHRLGYQRLKTPWRPGVGKKQEDEARKVAEGDGEASDHYHTR